jgi:multiple sugar transport system substrate-binding protein
MPTDLTLSLMNHNEGTVECLRSILQDFGPLNYREIDYDTGWAEFVRTAIYGGGLDVSEMGSTWISDFAAMNALRPLSLIDIRNLGGKDAFPPGLWRSGSGEQGVVWAVPWMTDIRVVYYRRDLLRQAGVDETDAFSTPEKFEQTLSRLSQAGIATPWVVPTRQSHITIHNLSMWLQHQGSDFVDSSGKRTRLNEAEARSALRAYFGLYRYLSPQAHRLAESESDSFFAQGHAAATVSGSWLYQYCVPEIRENIGLANPMGKAYIGGSSLVIWTSSRFKDRASELVLRLSSHEAQASLPRAAGLLPARLDTLEQSPFSSDPDLNRVAVNALKTGRPLPAIPLWGMIEDRLVRIFEMLWGKILAEPDVNLDQLLEEDLAPAVDRLNVVLSNY